MEVAGEDAGTTAAPGAAPDTAAATTAAGPAALAAAALAGCGGGAAIADPPVAPPPAAAPTRAQAARFLAQAGLSSSAAEIERVRTLGVAGWLDEQLAMPAGTGHVAWLAARGFGAPEYRNGQAGINNTLWRRLIADADVLRLRMALALSEILVISIGGLANTPFRAFAAGAWMDLLERHAFGNYRTLLGAVSTSPAMGAFLTFRGNRKADPARGSIPDENYAREVMQLFTIGLVELQRDGTPLLAGGKPKETYTQDDVSGLARVFTGWDLDPAVPAESPERVVRPMVVQPARHETGAKTFLGTTIAAGTGGEASLQRALDVLFTHPNVGPFVGRQLIQRLVASHPSPAYVGRVAAVFDDNGAGVRGDLAAVLRQVLLDDEARDERHAAAPHAGKLREPMLRFVQWARTFGARSTDGLWATIGDLSDPATRLGQSPLRAPSVFNFYRPGYVPPGGTLGAEGITAPEFQITTESSVAGYLNFMRNTIARGGSDFHADYADWLPLAGDTARLLEELDVVVAAGRIPPATRAALKTALDTIPGTTANGPRNRLHAALTMVFAAPDYLVLA